MIPKNIDCAKKKNAKTQPWTSRFEKQSLEKVRKTFLWFTVFDLRDQNSYNSILT